MTTPRAPRFTYMGEAPFHALTPQPLQTPTVVPLRPPTIIAVGPFPLGGLVPPIMLMGLLRLRDVGAVTLSRHFFQRLELVIAFVRGDLLDLRRALGPDQVNLRRHPAGCQRRSITRARRQDRRRQH